MKHRKEPGLQDAPGDCEQQTTNPLQTVAERSAWKATSTHADVMAFCRALVERSPQVTLEIVGKTYEGRELPLLILADPPIATPTEARQSGKLVCFAFGAIHAGEVCGKEGLLILAREIALTSNHPLLHDLVILFAPLMNADGNERMHPHNRPGQDGPEQGMGTRLNAMGLNLNRDWTKLETPENRAFARLMSRWDPAVILDLHATNGSRHQYILTYDAPRHPAAHADVRTYTRDHFLPAAGTALEAATGYRSFFYGNFDHDNTMWRTYAGLPRFTTHYGGLRHRLTILAEAYKYAPYQDRVMGTLEFVRHCFLYARDHKHDIQALLARVDAETIAAGNNPQEGNMVALRSEHVVDEHPVLVHGFAGEQPHTFAVRYDGQSRPTLSTPRPYAYLMPPTYTPAQETLQYHGIEVLELCEDIDLDVEVYVLEALTSAPTPVEHHHLLTVEVTMHAETRRILAGTCLIRTGQQLGSLAVFLLEPASEDGLCAWNVFDAGLTVGGEYPVLRLPRSVPLTTRPVRALAEERTFRQRVTYAVLYGQGPRPQLTGAPIGTMRWLDQDHFVQTKEGVPYTITAASGRATVHADPIQSKAMAAVLMGLDGIDDATARAMTARKELLLAPSMTGACMHYGRDLYYAALDGSAARRLTYTPEANEKWVEFSPDGQYVAFIRMHELYVVNVATATERQLTTGASEAVANGEMNWVYMEEVYGRGTQQAYWWSPDSTRIAFLQFDDTPVYPFGLINHLTDVQEIEFSRYPKAGEPNPHVRLGIVPVTGGEVVWADINNYAPEDRLITRVGWQPDSARLWCYMQNRAQTFLDFLTVTLTDGATQRLCRDENGQWVASSRPPTWLTDGSFLLFSERTGWRHLYHYSAAGVLIRPVTAGPWEVTSLESVDEARGVLFFCGTRDSHLARHLYRVRLDGSELTRLTHADGTHQVTVSPGGRYYIDTWSDIQLPTRVALFQGNNGVLVRRLDTNPVYAAEAWELGQYALVQIPTADGCMLDGSLLYPPDFDPKQRYPVWVQVYGGPHAPRIRNAFISRERDQLLANWGLIVFCVDPRSASSKGAISTWTAYRRLGVVECADLVTALEWLTTHPWVDGERIGMQGHSYGGFMTAYMMTHTRLLRAGVAGAPVTDWRLYDTIYTERYMDTPQRNPSGYDETSVLQAAANLHGRLLIVHGVLDNNVHMQHTMRLIDALQQANKQNFEIMVYPRHRHGLDSQHARDLVLNFIRRELLGLGPVGAEEVRHSRVCNGADGK